MDLLISEKISMLNYLKEMELLKMIMNTLLFYYNNTKDFAVDVVDDD